MQVNGTLIQILKRNSFTGETIFSFHTDKTDLLLCGTLFDMAKKTPLSIELTGKTRSVHLNGRDKTVQEIGMFYFYEDHGYLSEYLPSRFGFSSQLSEKILEKTKQKPFSGDYNIEDTVALITASIKTRQEDKIRQALSVMRQTYKEWKLYKGFIRLGGTYADAEDYKKDHADFFRCVTENPYSMLLYHIPFNKCEALGARSKMWMSEKKRVSETVRFVMTKSVQRGSTKMQFEEICDIIHYMERKAQSPFRTDPLFIADALLNTHMYHISEDEKNDTVWAGFSSFYQKEKSIAENVRRLERSAIRYSNDKISIEDIEKELDVSYSDDQKNAFNILSDGGVKILTGGPGTGKTTVLNGLIRKFKKENPSRTIALCAPTGKAAARMQETTGLPASTIHVLLNIAPYEGVDTSPKMIDADMVVADECSMLDAELGSYLFKAVKSGALVLLIGDEDQLEPVMAGNVFHDLLNSKSSVPIYRLTKIHRQGEDSVIVKNARKITTGDADLIMSERFHIITEPDENALIDKAVTLASDLYKKAPDSVRVFSPVKQVKFRAGSIQLNSRIQKTLRRKDEKYICYGMYRYYKGDRIVFNKNNYEEGYINGQDGIISDIQEFEDSRGSEINVTILSEGKYYHLKNKELSDIELSYAITAHKAQGSEVEKALIVVPKNPDNMLLKKLFYVEVTRAKEEVYVISEGDAWEEAILNKKQETIRDTWLKEMIDENEFI